MPTRTTLRPAPAFTPGAHQRLAATTQLTRSPSRSVVPRLRFCAVAHVLALAAMGAAGCQPETTEPGGGGSGGRGGSGPAPQAGAPAAGAGAGAAGSAGSSGGMAGAGGSVAPGSGGTGGAGAAGGRGGGAGAAPAADARRDGAAADRRAPDGRAGGTGDAAPAQQGRFSFFVTSLAAMRRLSGSQNGFGGNLTFGTPSGLEGADKICQTIAEGEGFGQKTWRAFLSAVRGPDGQPVHAIDRVGEGPWYDRNGRLIAMNKAGLTTGNRPAGDPQAVADLVDETGRGRPTSGPNDTHDTITGSNRMGRLKATGNNPLHTCQDWTTAAPPVGAMRPQIGFGHSWPSNVSGVHWIEVHTGRSCVPGVNLVSGGGGDGSSIGAGGGYGAFYCFALTP
jgi:hypothetical protein